MNKATPNQPGGNGPGNSKPTDSGLKFDPGLSTEERQIIGEEAAILDDLYRHLEILAESHYDSDYDSALLDLRDSLHEARADEVAQIVNQMSTLASLSDHQQQRTAERRVDTQSPYFGHMRVRQEGRVRDILIGSHTVVSSRLPLPIIDWRHAPISRVFYSYREGDEYEEEIGGRYVEGEIIAHRRLMIVGGRLLRIDCPQGAFHLADNCWNRISQGPLELKGGAGTALRNESLGSPGGPALGTGQTAGEGPDKHLRAITGLIDQEQFEMITRPESGIVVVDGGAGSGKTTIALHRMAYLSYHDPSRFSPEAMLGVVYSKALAAYISNLLPALGVSGVRIEVFDDFLSELRQQHFPTLHAAYSSSTPATVMRFKLHPAAWQYLERFVALRLNEMRSGLAEALGATGGKDAADGNVRLVLKAWDDLAEQSATMRIGLFIRWAEGRQRVAGLDPLPDDWLVLQRLRKHLEENFPDVTHPHVLPLAWWEEAFLKLDLLEEIMAELAPGEFSRDHLREIRDWAFRHFSEAEEYRAWQAQKKEGGGAGTTEPSDGDDENLIPPQPGLDREDDTLLLLLFSHTVGRLRSRKRRPLVFQHLTVDEAQDLGPLELRVLIGLAAEPRSVTLAGDTDQRMILHNSFTNWENVLEQLELESMNIKPLMVGYRSTREIMDFSRGVLGPLATERPWKAVRQGAPVELLRFTDPGQAVSVLADALRQLVRREPNASVALITRHPAQADLYHQGLLKSEVPSLRRVAEQDFTFKPGIEVTDILQVKGLEFDYVVMLDVDRQTYPDDSSSRYLLHIGATRAAHQLWLVTCMAPSVLLPEGLAMQFL
ncbi:MAG: ATP-binding domain-containing protein [Deltaproteobacteria bacterium]|nr:ATP-binding domain-containing protein [Deltaproteobacteria bacterium]